MDYNNNKDRGSTSNSKCNRGKNLNFRDGPNRGKDDFDRGNNFNHNHLG